MMRCARVVTVLMVLMLGAATTSRAQTTDTGPNFADVNIAATLGHKSDMAFGGEFGREVVPNIDVFIEAGHMGNVATSDLEARALLIADAIGATVNTIAKANFFDVGARYRFSPYGMWRPYVALGIGAAWVRPEVSFNANGQDLTPLVSLGADLSGTTVKPMLMLGGGAAVNVASRYFVDLSYRYGHIFAKSGTIENDVAIKTQRIQAGFGVRF